MTLVRDTDTYESPSRVPAALALLLVLLGFTVLAIAWMLDFRSSTGATGAAAYGIANGVLLVGASALVLAGAALAVVSLIVGSARVIAVVVVALAVGVGVLIHLSAPLVG